jgi:catechol 2,3-dioxygenase-like lactoylglutathione lyase family enzyme
MDVASITAVLPAEDLARARTFYTQKVGLTATDGMAGVTIGTETTRLFLYPSMGRSPGSFTQTALLVGDVRAAVAELRSRGVEFEGFDGPGIRTEDGIAHMPDGDDAAWFKDSEGNLLVLVPAR